LSTPPPPHQLSLVLLTEYLLSKCFVVFCLDMSSQLHVGCKRRKQYAPKFAIAMVRSGQCLKKGAANMYIYGVPRTTLLDKLAGRVPEENVRPGKKPVLKADKERKLVDFANTMCNVCFRL